MGEVRLDVRIAGTLVGHLERDRYGLTTWIPDSSWIQAGQHPRLGLDFLRQPGPIRAATGLPPWFENLLPERDSALRTALCGQWSFGEGDDLALLSALGGDLPGAVDVRSELVETERNPDTETSVSAPWRFSLAGMQIKLSMGQRGNRFAVPAREGENGDWIVKLPGAEFPDLPEIEHATMNWAKASGFEVPENHVVKTDLLDGVQAGWSRHSANCFLIRRFDRRMDATRIHHEDFCQALSIRPIHKYGNSGPSRVGFDGAMRMVLDTCGEVEARIFARRIGFTIASGNGDAHLKNWSLEWGSADRPKLSPCYDLVSTVRWERFGWSSDNPKGPELGLGLGRIRQFRNLGSEALRRHSKQSGVPWAGSEIENGIVRARNAWKEPRFEIPIEMRMALETHWSRVPILRDLGPLYS